MWVLYFPYRTILHIEAIFLKVGFFRCVLPRCCLFHLLRVDDLPETVWFECFRYWYSLTFSCKIRMMLVYCGDIFPHPTPYPTPIKHKLCQQQEHYAIWTWKLFLHASYLCLHSLLISAKANFLECKNNGLHHSSNK